jgi:microsomal epoxide hydrolase
MTEGLGYAVGAHGGLGSFVTEQLARGHAASDRDPPDRRSVRHIFQPPKDLSPRREVQSDRTLAARERRVRDDPGHAAWTAAAGLRDSPVAWRRGSSKFHEWSDCGTDLERSFSRDELLTNVVLYWVTGTIESSFQPYREVVRGAGLRWMAEAARAVRGAAKTAAGFALFPKDISSPPRAWAERFFDVKRWTVLPRGGHFGALEEPELLAEDIRSFFRPLRRTH